MTTLTNNASISANTNKAPMTLASVVATLFAVELRESLDAATSGDKSDAAYVWGL